MNAVRRAYAPGARHTDRTIPRAWRRETPQLCLGVMRFQIAFGAG